MQPQSEKETVDRSRLKLLGVLAAAGASGACVQQAEYYPPSGRGREVQPRTTGGEGEGGGGGGSH